MESMPENIETAYPPIKPGTEVITTQANIDIADEWTKKAAAQRKWGVVGLVIAHHDSHGLCYDVKHTDGSIGSYDPSEFETTSDS